MGDVRVLGGVGVVELAPAPGDAGGYFDEVGPRVARAFLEWQQRTRWKIVRHLDIGWWGRSYIVYLDKEAVVGVL